MVLFEHKCGPAYKPKRVWHSLLLSLVVLSVSFMWWSLEDVGFSKRWRADVCQKSAGITLSVLFHLRVKSGNDVYTLCVQVAFRNTQKWHLCCPRWSRQKTIMFSPKLGGRVAHTSGINWTRTKETVSFTAFLWLEFRVPVWDRFHIISSCLVRYSNHCQLCTPFL